MKRAMFFVLLLTAGLALFSQNLVVNPGFENWGKTDKPDLWILAESCRKDSIHIKSGSYSCRQEGGTSTSNNTRNLGQTLSVIAGNQYRFSFFYKTEITGTANGCRIWCSWKDATDKDITDSLAKQILQPSEYMKSNTWQFFSIDIIAPTNAKSFYLQVRTYKNSIAYWDDFRFEESVATFEPEKKLQDIKIYPNPARDYLIVSNLQHLQHINIQDFTGKHIWSSDFSGEETVTIPVSKWADGLYIISIQTSDKVITRKFIRKAN
jgi:hypothetical protein